MLLELNHITKYYPGVVALDDVCFSLNAGEVHCLIGENGAGKSTLIKILAGALHADSGSIVIDGKSVRIDNPVIAQKYGIGTIYQDYKLVPELSVAENITIGHAPIKKGIPFIDNRKMKDIARTSLKLLGEEIDITTKISHLTTAQRQIVEIAKALSHHVRILTLDEPTAALTEHEIENLFRVIRRLKEEGVGVIYISHRLEEIFEIGNRVSVLRDGKNVESSEVSSVDRRTLIRWMVGREIENEYPKIELTRDDEILRVEHVNTPKLHDINLVVHKREIFGIAGLVGSGRSELARVIFAADPLDSGKIFFCGKELKIHSPHEAIENGIGLLTEDRNRLGLILQMKVRENISLASLRDFLRGIFIDKQRESNAAKKFTDELNIKPPYPEMEVDKLSGGNRQKVILARWLNTKAKLLIFDEPTAGIDVGAKFEIYTMINRLAQDGIGVIVVSSDLPALLGICNRIAVMCEGRITDVVNRTEFSQEKIMNLATLSVDNIDSRHHSTSTINIAHAINDSL